MTIPADDIRHDVARLSELLRERKENARILYNYYDGNHPMPWAHAKAKPAYKTLLRQAINNFPQLVVDSLNDRLSVSGFRIDGDDADIEAWRTYWQENDLDIRSPMVQLEALITGVSYMGIWPEDDEKDSKVRISAESCFEVFHEVDPSDPFDVRRALKTWPNKFDAKWYGRYFADGLYYKLEAPLENKQLLDYGMQTLMEPAKWVVVEVLDNPLGEDASPFVPFVNRPGIDGTGRGEFADVLPNIDRINTLTAQMLLAGEFSAFKIKWATGIDIPTDDEGNDIEPFDVAMDRLWVSENETAKFGALDATDLGPYQAAVNQAIQHLAAITRTPPFMLLGNLTNLSAEALKATESGQVKKARQRQISFGESYEHVMRKAFAAAGDGRATASSMETVWADPENVSESQHVDALSKLYAMGLPQKAVWELYGATPVQIESWDAMRAEDVMHRVMLASASRPPGLNPGPADAGQQGQPGQQQSGPQGGSPTGQLQQMPDAGNADA